MYKKILCVLYCATTCLAAFAQSVDSTAKSIAKIKRDSQYLYAEATMKEAGEAVEGAKAILETAVGQWVQKQYPDENIEVCIVKAKEHCQLLQTQRGNYYRAFIYVKKGDIMPVSDKSEVAIFQVKSADKKSIQETSEPISKDKATTGVILNEEEKRMLCIRRFSDIESYVKGLQDTGKLNGYGKYATLPEGAECHLFVYNREGVIVALLRSEGNEQVNLGTLQRDDIKSYKNCGAIWLQLNTKNL